MPNHKTLAGPLKLSVVALVVMFMFVSSVGVASAAPIPPHIHFTHAEEDGHIDIDLRYDEKTHAYTTLTIFQFVNDVGGAAGTYYWNHVLNGRPMAKHFETKDDNLHTIFRMSEGWMFGDVYKFQATHYSPATQKTYVAAYNECVITPR